jgi:hypothetical protein
MYDIFWYTSAEAGQTALDQKEKADTAGGIERKSTRTWAMETGYDAKKIFNKVLLWAKINSYVINPYWYRWNKIVLL